MRRYMACGWMLAALTCVLLLVGGCNSDIFLDKDNVQADMAATIDGDGGEATFKISTKGLKSIGISGMTAATLKRFTFYDAAGDVIAPESDPLKISRVAYVTDFDKLTIDRRGETLTFKSIYHTGQYYSEWDIWLEYDYGVRTVTVIVAPGKPLTLEDVHYDGVMEITDNGFKTRKTVFANNGPSPAAIETMPYIQEQFSILVDPAQSDSWLRGEKITIDVPYFDDGIWDWREKSLNPGYALKHSPSYVTTKETVEVPADSKGEIVTTVYYTRATAKGTMTFLNEIAGIRLQESFTATSIFPTHYEIKIENAR